MIHLFRVEFRSHCVTRVVFKTPSSSRYDNQLFSGRQFQKARQFYICEKIIFKTKMILLLVLSLKHGLIKVAKLGGSGASVNCCSKDGCNWNASTAQVMMNLIFFKFYCDEIQVNPFQRLLQFYIFWILLTWVG